VTRRPGAALAALAAAVALGAWSCGGDDDPEGLRVEGAWARATPPGVTVGAVYLRVTSNVDDELLGADVDESVAAAVELHSTEQAADGTTRMVEQKTLPVPAGDELVLEPIGHHLMLVDLADPLTTGETFDLTLHFATAGDHVVEVEVREDAP
jgi:hypothetical protein